MSVPASLRQLQQEGTSSEHCNSSTAADARKNDRLVLEIPHVISQQEATLLLQDLDQEEWSWEGYCTKRRVQRYTSSTSVMPEQLHQIVKHLFHKKHHQLDQVIVEEHYANPDPQQDDATNIITSFEPSMTSQCCGCNTDKTQQPDNVTTTTTTANSVDVASSCCFVAYLPLVIGASSPANNVAHNHKQLQLVLEQPAISRKADCWKLAQPPVRIDMQSTSLYVAQNDTLWEYKSAITVVNSDDASKEQSQQGNSMSNSNKDRFVVVKFVCLPCSSSSRHDTNDNPSSTPVSSHQEDQEEMPSPLLSELLTIVITTSPIKSHPSTELLERTLSTFYFGGAEFSQQCRKIIVCDGCRILEENDNTNNNTHSNRKKISRKHSNVKQALRNGIATGLQAENYQKFKQDLRQLCEDNTPPFHNATVVELKERHGYGFALRHAVQKYVSTKYVCVIQHDRTFMRPTPIPQVVQTMYASSSMEDDNDNEIKYVGMSMRSNLTYRDLFLSKYGTVAHDELSDLILRPSHLKLDASMYGPTGQSVQIMLEETSSDTLRNNLVALAETYKGTVQYLGQQECVQQQQQQQCGGTEENYDNDKQLHQLTLTPTLFWYDNTHICETAHYRDYIYNPKYKMVARGGFVEDKLSPVILKSVERLGLKEGHGRFGCYLLDDHSGYFFTGHLDGGSYLTMEERKQYEKKKE